MSTVLTPQRRAWLLRNMRDWHWISGAVSFAALLLFSVTGITLNHAASIEARPGTDFYSGTLPPAIRSTLADAPANTLPSLVCAHLESAIGTVWASGDILEWSDHEVYLSRQSPGGDAWVTINRDDGTFEAERTDRGVIAWLNDLHKGRHTSDSWGWFIDGVAVVCCLFAVTGIVLMLLQARTRRNAWSTVGAGALVMSLFAVWAGH